MGCLGAPLTLQEDAPLLGPLGRTPVPQAVSVDNRRILRVAFAVDMLRDEGSDGALGGKVVFK